MILERRPNDYVQRNLLLQLTLGLLSSADALDDLLARYAAPDAERAGEPDGEAEPSALTILGMIAFGARLRGALAGLPGPAAAEAEGDVVIGGLLR